MHTKAWDRLGDGDGDFLIAMGEMMVALRLRANGRGPNKVVVAEFAILLSF